MKDKMNKGEKREGRYGRYIKMGRRRNKRLSYKLEVVGSE